MKYLITDAAGAISGAVQCDPAHIALQVSPGGIAWMFADDPGFIDHDALKVDPASGVLTRLAGVSEPPNAEGVTLTRVEADDPQA